jgi:CheY-like chemotaxis protein
MDNRKSPYLLLADDDLDDQEMLAESFLRWNPNVGIRYFKDGQEVLSFLDQCPTDELPLAMILDYKMPILTGVEVLAALENDPRFRNIPKLVWSTSGNSQYIQQCLSHGAERYFVKPSDLAHMDQIVSYLTHLFRSRSPVN